MGKRSHVVKELRVHRPAFKLLPDAVTNERALKVVDRIFEQYLFVFGAILQYNGTQSFVFSRKRPVLRRSGGREPAFVNTSALSTQNIIVIRMQFYPSSRYAK